MILTIIIIIIIIMIIILLIMIIRPQRDVQRLHPGRAEHDAFEPPPHPAGTGRSFAPISSFDKRFARQYRYEPPPEFPLTLP